MNATTIPIPPTLAPVLATGCAGSGDGTDRSTVADPFDFPRVTGLDPLDVPHRS